MGVLPVHFQKTWDVDSETGMIDLGKIRDRIVLPSKRFTLPTGDLISEQEGVEDFHFDIRFRGKDQKYSVCNMPLSQS